jgi:hypothetical protein
MKHIQAIFNFFWFVYYIRHIIFRLRARRTQFYRSAVVTNRVLFAGLWSFLAGISFMCMLGLIAVKKDE